MKKVLIWVIALFVCAGSLLLISCDMSEIDISIETEKNRSDDGQSGMDQTDNSVCSHSFLSATCTSPATCQKCGKTNGDALGHQWSNATCGEHSTCVRCGTAADHPVEHRNDGGVCSICGTNLNTGSVTFRRDYDVKVDLSGRGNYYDMVNLTDYFDMDYLRSQGYTKFRIEGKIDIKWRSHIAALTPIGAKQYLFFYPTQKSPSGNFDAALTGATIPTLFEQEFACTSTKFKTYNFSTNIEFDRLAENRIYVRFDINNLQHIWTNKNLVLVITPIR